MAIFWLIEWTGTSISLVFETLSSLTLNWLAWRFEENGKLGGQWNGVPCPSYN